MVSESLEWSTVDCELSDMGARDKLWSSARSVITLSH